MVNPMATLKMADFESGAKAYFRRGMSESEHPFLPTKKILTSNTRRIFVIVGGWYDGDFVGEIAHGYFMHNKNKAREVTSHRRTDAPVPVFMCKAQGS